MALSSINTNVAAMVALQSLNKTNTSLSMTEKRISTGYRVADATDDGAAFAVAQSVRSDVAALTSANQQLGNVQGLLGVTNTALTNVSNTMINARSILVKLGDSTIQGNERSQYTAQYNSIMSNLKSFIQDAAYNGKTLIGNFNTHSGVYGTVNVSRNENGNNYCIATFDSTTFYHNISYGAVTLGNATSVSSQITAGGTFTTQFANIGTQLNKYGYATNYVNSQVSYNNDKIDALNTGLGALIDADLTKESAQLQALQVRQQLGTQALSIANQSPQSLLSLFK